MDEVTKVLTKQELERHKEIAYQNAIDCLHYGYGRKHWDSQGLPKEIADEIWHKAFERMASDF